MKESERGQEQLYICDHADANCGCTHYKPHKHGVSCCTGCCTQDGITVSCIPYKEEAEKTCLTCGVPGDCMRSVPSDLHCWIPKEEKPATKRVGVIWFGDVPESQDVAEIYYYDKNHKVHHDVELIDFDRVSIETRGSGAKIYHVDPPKPTPEPETVEDVFKDIYETADFDEYEVTEFKNRIKAAQEREG